ncbi:MAG TPA: hypothetical protein VLH38_01210 [Patescibacteria group bacterium]|nr:hypothetical protein [Patescibacteria group bacterium]
MPEVPAMPFAEDPLALQTRIIEQLEGKGIDPGTVHEIDLNKTERHTIAGYYIGEQRQHLVTGEGAEATFENFATSGIIKAVRGPFSRMRNERRFRKDLQTTLCEGASDLENRLQSGPNKEWAYAARARYAALGERAVGLVTPKQQPHFLLKRLKAVVGAPQETHGIVPREGVDLSAGLRTNAIGNSVHYLRFIRKHVKDPAMRVKAAHELTQLITAGWAGLHVEELAKIDRPLRFLKATVARDEKDIFRVKLAGKNRNRHRVYPRIEPAQLSSAKLKCPAHATEANREDTNLEHILHAAINAAVEYGLL